VVSVAASFLGSGAGVSALADITATTVTAATIGTDASITLSQALAVSASASNTARASAAAAPALRRRHRHAARGLRARRHARQHGRRRARRIERRRRGAGVNTAEAANLAVSISAAGSLGVTGAVASITQEADVEARGGTDGSVAASGALRVAATSTNTAKAESDVGSGSLGLSIAASRLRPRWPAARRPRTMARWIRPRR